MSLSSAKPAQVFASTTRETEKLSFCNHPGDPRYQDKKRRDREWETRERARQEWAKKRLGKPLAHIDKFWHDDVDDKIMRDYLRGEGLLPEPEQPTS